MPHTTHEIAELLESLAVGQDDRALASKLREWSHDVEQHGNFALRARAASIQGELYKTLEDHIGEIKESIDGLRDIIYDTHTIAQSNQQRHEVADHRYADDSQKIVGMAALVEQIRSRLVDLDARLVTLPAPAEITQLVAQIYDHEVRITDLEHGHAEGGNGDAAD